MEIGRKLYSVTESYWVFYNGIRTMKYMYRCKRKGELSSKFIERIMLAVTEVNHCSLCSHAHTKKALESGMTCEEIRKIMAGSMEDIPDDEVAAVTFAKYYADSRAHPSKKSWEHIIDVYGVSKAMGILGSIRTIMIGNIYGIPWSSFFNRLKKNPDPRSSLKYEIIMMLGTFLVPVSLFHALISSLARKPIINIK